MDFAERVGDQQLLDRGGVLLVGQVAEGSSDHDSLDLRLRRGICLNGLHLLLVAHVEDLQQGHGRRDRVEADLDLLHCLLVGHIEGEE